jgi:hypothetical protein
VPAPSNCSTNVVLDAARGNAECRPYVELLPLVTARDRRLL